MLEHGGQINHLVSWLDPMLLFDVTFDTGEENKIGRKHRTWYSRCKIEYSRGMVDKWRDNSLFQETNYLEYCSESRKFFNIFRKSVHV